MSKGVCRVSLYKGRQSTNGDFIFRKKSLPIIVIDETGGMGPIASYKVVKRPHFTIVGALIEEQRSFKKTKDFFPKKNQEIKYSNTTMVECIPIFEYLATQDFLFSEMHKSRRNTCFQSKNQIKTYIDMVAHVLRENEPDCLHDVLIDSPPVAASEELINLCEDLIEQGSKIEFFEVRPSANDWILQAHDFITGAVGDNVEGIGCKCDLYNMIKDKKRKL